MLAALLAVATITTCTPPRETLADVENNERTSFQTASFYNPRIHIPADVAIVYGIGKDMPARVKSWKDAGYHVSLMTGVSWGEYQDYLYGRFDGINHENEAQQEKSGYKISHGGDVYYMSPGPTYGKFLSQGVKRAIDAGVEAIYLEEPEFWVRGGYGDGFKKEWLDFYKTPWRDPESSVDARWKANKLMYVLYRRALQQVFDFVQDYNKTIHKRIRCYVATHSLLNYAHWGIVSPESSLAQLNGCDGYIAQVWTGTARTPNVYQGQRKERTFETAYLEYGAAMNMVRGTNRRMTFLADPIEDNPDHDWGDYRRNWESCVLASLLHPAVNHYEVMPWPERIFNGTYPSESDHKKRVPIPDSYATEIQVVCNALEQQAAPLSTKQEKAPKGFGAVGVLVSDSLMYERGGPDASDPDMSHFYGLALPLEENGIPVTPVQYENSLQKGYLNPYSTLLLTLEGMKPLSPKADFAIAQWVRDGGDLIVFDDDQDPFNNASSWWSRLFKTPREHLFRALKVPYTRPGKTKVGKGTVEFIPISPTTLAHQPDGYKEVLRRVEPKFTRSSFEPTWRLSSFRLPYWLVSNVGNGPKDGNTKAYAVDLFDPELNLTTATDVAEGGRHLYRLINPNPVPQQMFSGGTSIPSIIAAAGSIPKVNEGPNLLSFNISGIEGTQAITLLQLPIRPRIIQVAKQTVDFRWDETMHLAWIKFPNHAIAQNVIVKW